MKKIVILISGRGSNMRSLIEAAVPAKIAAVISNRPEAAGLAFARERQIETAVLDHRTFNDRETFDEALATLIEGFEPDYVVLAGFMRILTEKFVQRFSGRLVNIHPSLLPAFPGLSTHARALAAGVKIHGCTVHFVTPTVDHGPIIAQAAVPVHAEDTEERLAQRVLAQEHLIYPLAVRWLVEGRLELTEDGKVNLRDQPVSEEVLISPRR